MKKVLLALTLTFAALTANIARADEPTVDLRSEAGYLVRVRVSEIKASYKKIVESEMTALETIAQSEQEIYKFAVSHTGLNMSIREGIAFAERLAQNVEETNLVKVVNEAGTYALSHTGLNMSLREAAKFVELLLSFPQAQQRLALHKKTFAFGLSHTGMNLSLSEARAYADRKCGLDTK
jgi:hypothetical protein